MFFYLSKVFWALLAPSSFFVLCAGIIAICYARSRERKNLFLRVLSVLVVIASLGIFVLPLGDWAIATWEKHAPSTPVLPAKIDNIIILGGSTERLTSVISLAHRYPKARIIFSGGSGSVQRTSEREADAARKLFDEWGLPAKNISYDRNSRNTYENAVNVKKMIGKEKPGNWLLVTSASHMTRAYHIFDHQGLEVLPYPVDYEGILNAPVLCFCAKDNFDNIDNLTHELIGYAVYKMTGKL